ncbi:MAG: hypothetical protein ACRDHZ_19000, partial [Ktedonobacteraceae bacterium]
MAYEWLCGQRPYSASSPEELLFQQEHEPLPAPSSFNPHIKPRIEEILLQALAVNPLQRFPLVSNFFDAYLHALMGRPFTITPIHHSSMPVTKANTPEKLALHGIPITAAKKGIAVKKRPTTITTTNTDATAEYNTANMQRQSFVDQTHANLPQPPIDTQMSNKLTVTHTPLTQLPPVAPKEALLTVTRRAATPAEQMERTSTPLSTLSDLQYRVESDLRQGGALSNALSGYEERPAQIEMATLIASSLSANTPAVIEASTGTGKSLSYLIPVVRSGKVAIISTANKALQEQLFFKDIPFVQKHIRHFDAALVKGMSNYICLDRLAQEREGMQRYVK